jgi:hypothetical protein
MIGHGEETYTTNWRFSIARASLGQTGLFYRPVFVAGVQPTGTLPSTKVNTMQSEVLGKQSRLKQNSKTFLVSGNQDY